MTKQWKSIALGKIAEVKSGGTPSRSKPEYWNGEIPWYSSGELNSQKTCDPERFISAKGLSESNAKLFPQGSLLIGMYDTAALKMSILDRDGTFNQAVAGVQPNTEICLKFIMHAINSMKPEILSQRRGVRQKNLSLTKIKEITIPLPSLEEQNRIVSILDEAFEGIEKAQANAEQNLANARELFNSYMDSIFTKQGKGWEERKLEDIAYLAGRIGWKGLTAKEYTKEGPLFISVHSLNYGDYVDCRDAFHISQERYDESPEIMLQPHDVLICKDGAGIGKMGIIKELPGPATINSSLLLIRALKDVKPKYLYRVLCGSILQKLVQERIDGATTPHLYQREIKQFLIPVPPLAEQDKIIEKLDAISTESGRLQALYEQKLKDLDELKQSLLQKAFSGELTANNVVAFTQPVQDQITTVLPEFTANVLAFSYHWHASQQKERTFGRVKAQKILHMTESVAGVDMGRQPIKDAAGPNDFQHMLKAEEWATANQFFEFTPKRSGNGYDFKKLGDYNRLIDGALKSVKPYKDKFEKILSLMMPMNTREAEVLATVHASWNNLLLDDAEVTDDKIFESCKTWHERKKPITKNELQKAITTIRTNGIVPDGTAKRVTGQESMAL